MTTRLKVLLTVLGVVALGSVYWFWSESNEQFPEAATETQKEEVKEQLPVADVKQVAAADQKRATTTITRTTYTGSYSSEETGVSISATTATKIDEAILLRDKVVTAAIDITQENGPGIEILVNGWATGGPYDTVEVGTKTIAIGNRSVTARVEEAYPYEDADGNVRKTRYLIAGADTAHASYTVLVFCENDKEEAQALQMLKNITLK